MRAALSTTASTTTSRRRPERASSCSSYCSRGKEIVEVSDNPSDGERDKRYYQHFLALVLTIMVGDLVSSISTTTNY
jgi:hypothetical protein